MSAPVRVWWLPAMFLLLVSTVALHAQGKTTADGSMTELVAEVRALRQAVERTSGLSARTQALLGRVQLQENRLADLGRRLDEARQRVRTSASQEAQVVAELAMHTATMQGFPAEERAAFEVMLQASRGRLKAAQAEAAQLRAAEGELLGALADEQARWSDFNGRLEAIEQEFVRAGGRQP